MFWSSELRNMSSNSIMVRFTFPVRSWHVHQFLWFDIFTMLNRLMCHVDRHLILLSYLRRGSSKENEMARKEFKPLYANNNRRVDQSSQHLLSSWQNRSSVNADVQVDDDDDQIAEETYDETIVSEHPLSFTTHTDGAQSLPLKQHHRRPPNLLHRSNLSMTTDGVRTWRAVQYARFLRTTAQFDDIPHKRFFGGDWVYDRPNRRDEVWLHYGSDTCFGLIYGAFAHTASLSSPSASCFFYYCNKRPLIPETHPLSLNMVMSAVISAHSQWAYSYCASFHNESNTISNVCIRYAVFETDILYSKIFRPDFRTQRCAEGRTLFQTI